MKVLMILAACLMLFLDTGVTHAAPTTNPKITLVGVLAVKGKPVQLSYALSGIKSLGVLTFTFVQNNKTVATVYDVARHQKDTPGLGEIHAWGQTGL